MDHNRNFVDSLVAWFHRPRRGRADSSPARDSRDRPGDQSTIGSKSGLDAPCDPNERGK